MSIVFSASLRCQLPVLLLIFQGAFIAIFILFFSFEEPFSYLNTSNVTATAGVDDLDIFPLFKDVHIMLFAGLGLMLSFLRLYGFGGIAINFLIANFSIQWAMVVQGFFYHFKHGMIHLRLNNILEAEFAAVTALISAGAVLGRTSPVQLILLSALEIPLFVINDWLVNKYFHILDIGGTVAIHIFSCYFGLGISQILYQPSLQRGHKKETTTSNSDLLSLLGTIFLWIFWPSFNSVLAKTREAQHRAIVNTFLALSSGTMTTFAMSSLVDKRGRISLAHLQNASLAGGVAVGISADIISPGGAFSIGCLASMACTLGFQYLSPFLAKKIKLQDQCGIHNLHGLPGIIGTIGSIVVILLGPFDTYGSSLHETLYSNGLDEQPILGVLGNRETWTTKGQALQQAAALGVTIGVSLFGGYITGLLMRLPCFFHPFKENYFDDQLYFQVSEDIENKWISNEKLQEHLLVPLKQI
ncbi:ammonium transporter Rh type A-like [Bufo gargarizans]|uniref:ammonium transporter Rh type A-like n=1 Tax=Bufo gargarizans TaxID=30331 RepID=UPI001CF2B417|nr:ammonium transporter Rh type A-like [Bufo gargarizans]